MDLLKTDGSALDPPGKNSHLAELNRHRVEELQAIVKAIQ